MRFTLCLLVTLISLVSGLAVTPRTSSSLEERATALRNIQSKVLIGVGATASRLSGTYANIVKTEFNLLTPENEMKWDATERTQNVFTYTSADTLVNFAQANGMKLRGHTLCWHSQTPSWVQNLAASALTTALQNHIANVAGHFKGKIYAWDVVNEIFSDNNDGSYRSSFWYTKLGTTFPVIALKAARAADPAAKLYINDYSVEGINAKSTALYNLAKTLKSQGLLDGVGFQAHLIVGQVPSNMQANLQRFADLGLDVAITELDVRMATPPSAANLAQQAKDFASVTNICQAVSRCVSLTQWDVGYTDSWVPSTFPGQGAAVMWDANYQPTAAYTATANALAS